MSTALRRLSNFTAMALAAMAAFSAHAQNAFEQTNLVSDDPDLNPQIVDPNMLDAWGIALRPPGAGGHIWIANGFTGTSSEYIGDVNGIPLHQDGLTTVTLDTPGFTDHGFALVTGQVYNAASDFAGQPVEFQVSGPAVNYNNDPPTVIQGGTSGSAKFVFVTEDGAINAWRSNTATAMTSAPVMVDYSKTANYPYAANSVFTGVAMTVNPYTSAAFTIQGGNHLFATDMRNDAIQVFDNQWRDVTAAYYFETPASVGDLSPFNITDLGGRLFVSYALFNPGGDEGQEQTSGPGLGHVVEYDETGHLVKDFADHGNLDTPWGMTLAPGGFGKFGGDLLVGNFGDGTIAAFDPITGEFVDDLRDSSGDAVSIDGLWGLTFGNGVSLGDANSLYFTAGPNAEQNGLFGKLTETPEPTTGAMLALAVGFLGFRRGRRVS